MESKVHVIDDEPVVRMSMEALINSLGVEATAYSNAIDFLDTFVDGEPALQCVIVDLRMPQMSGVELKYELAKQGSDVPVVLLTGFCTHEAQEQAEAAGIFEILEKPCRPEALKELIQRAFDSIATK